MRKIFFILGLISATLFASPKAVVFDFGGVMTKKPERQRVVEFLCTTLNLSKSEFEKVNVEKRVAFQKGTSDIDFWEGVAKTRNISLPNNWKASYKEVSLKAINPNQEMYDLVAELKKQNVVVGMLSNIDDRLATMIRDFGLYEPFSPCILSCDVGSWKPDTQIYKALLSKVNVPAGDIIFIDDKQENIDAAKKMGIDAILFSSVKQLKVELQQRGLLI